MKVQTITVFIHLCIIYPLNAHVKQILTKLIPGLIHTSLQTGKKVSKPMMIIQKGNLTCPGKEWGSWKK